MTRRPLAFAALLLLAAATACSGEPATVFVSSSPLRAALFVDGKPLADRTPVLLRDLPAGRHALLLRKDGYADLRIDVELSAGEVRSLSPALSAAGVAIAVGGAAEVEVAGTTHPGSALLQLPSGTYGIDRAGERVLLRPIYPAEKAIGALDLLVPVCAVLAGLSTAQDILYRQGSTHFFSPLTISSYALVVVGLGADVVLRVGRSRWQRSFRVATRQEAPAETEAAVTARAQAALEQGLLDEAVAAFLRHVELYPDSVALPSSLYQIGRIYQMRGEAGLAAATFRLLLAEYPVPDLYDKAAKGLAEVQASSGDYAAALDSLAGMLMVDPLYTPEEVQAYRCELLDAWAGKDEARRGEAVAARRELLRAWPESARAAEYHYRLARELWGAGEGAEASAEAALARAGASEELARSIAELEAEIGGAK